MCVVDEDEGGVNAQTCAPYIGEARTSKSASADMGEGKEGRRERV